MYNKNPNVEHSVNLLVFVYLDSIVAIKLV